MTPSAATLLWLRDDLRLDDNPALAAACEAGSPLLIVYVLESGESFRPLGAAARWWLHRSLAALSAALEARGQRLILRAGSARDVVPGLARQAEAKRVVWNRRYGPGAAIDAEIESALVRDGIAVSTFKANLLSEPEEVRGPRGPMKVYSAFRRKVQAGLPPRPPIPPPSRLGPPLPDIAGEGLEAFALLPAAPDWAGGLRETWTPGEDGAHERLAAFLDRGLATYAGDRDYPAADSTSHLSPHLRFGEISPFRILAALGDVSGPGAAKFAGELGWREFAWHVFGSFPEMGTANLRPEFNHFPWLEPAADDLRAWQKGLTGYPIVDAGMRQLWRTGWMHNRVRMIVASFLTKHLLVDWRVGEAWFWATLVDADPANNPFGWQWVAGPGFDAQPYFRIFNPVLQGEKFDPHGAFVRRWVPELAALADRVIHRPWEASPLELRAAGVRLGRDYPRPLIDHAFARRRALAAFEAMRAARYR